MPSVRSPTAVALAVAGVVLLVYAGLTGGAVIAFAVEAFAVTAYLLAPYARGAGEDDDDDGEDDDGPGPPGPRSAPELGDHQEDRDEHEPGHDGLGKQEPAERRVVLGRVDPA